MTLLEQIATASTQSLDTWADNDVDRNATNMNKYFFNIRNRSVFES